MKFFKDGAQTLLAKENKLCYPCSHCYHIILDAIRIEIANALECVSFSEKFHLNSIFILFVKRPSNFILLKHAIKYQDVGSWTETT